MKSVFLDGLTVGAANKKTLVSYIRSLLSRAELGEVIFDPSWSTKKSLRVLGRMLKMAKSL